MLSLRLHKPAIALAAFIVLGMMVRVHPLRAQVTDDSTTPESVADAKTPKPKAIIKVSTKNLKFGTHKTGTITRKHFTIKNRSKTETLTGKIFVPVGPPLVIVQVNGSFPGGSFVLSPKGKLTIWIQFSPGLAQGPFQLNLPIDSDDPVTPQLNVLVTATAKAR